MPILISSEDQIDNCFEALNTLGPNLAAARYRNRTTEATLPTEVNIRMQMTMRFSFGLMNEFLKKAMGRSTKIQSVKAIIAACVYGMASSALLLAHRPWTCREM